MLNCKQVFEDADSLLAEELGTWQRLRVQMHLLICHHCRRYVRQLRVMVGALAGLHGKVRPEEVKKIMDIARRGD